MKKWESGSSKPGLEEEKGGKRSLKRKREGERGGRSGRRGGRR